LGYAVPLAHDAAESGPQQSGIPDNFLAAFDPNAPAAGGLFRESLQNSADLCGLTPSQVVNRATALSCAGCHQPSTFGLTTAGALGPVQLPGGVSASTWPDSLSFVHTSETADGNGVHALSDALNVAFLPARRKFLLGELNSDVCDCDRTFTDLDPAEREKAKKVQIKVDAKFKVRRANEWKQLYDAKRKAHEKRKSIGVKDVRQSAKRLDEIAREQAAELNKELAKEGIEVRSSGTGTKAHPWKFDVVKRAGGSKKKERELRAQAVVEQIRSEPPRRTVTGHFRVH
jgi:hypothetical protein